MFSTQEVVKALQSANPDARVNEDRIRHVIRRGEVSPRSFAGRLAWSPDDVTTLASALRLTAPRHDGRDVATK